MGRAATVLSVGLIIAYLLWVATPWKNDLAAVLLTAIDLSDRFVQLARERVTGAQVEKIDTRYLAFPGAIFDGVWASFSVLHIRANEIRKTLDGFKSVLTESGLFLAAVHRGPKTEWIRATISGMERDTYLQEWLQLPLKQLWVKLASRLSEAALSREQVDATRCSAPLRTNEQEYFAALCVG